MVRTQKVKWAVSGRAKDSRRPLRLRSFSPPDFAPIRRHPQQPRGSKRMLAVCRAGSKVTEVLAQYAGLTKSGRFTHNLALRPPFEGKKSTNSYPHHPGWPGGATLDRSIS